MNADPPHRVGCNSTTPNDDGNSSSSKDALNGIGFVKVDLDRAAIKWNQVAISGGKLASRSKTRKKKDNNKKTKKKKEKKKMKFVTLKLIGIQ